MWYCNKLGYVTYGEAERVAKRMRRNCDGSLQAFRCDRCGLFHVGNHPAEDAASLRDFRRRKRALIEADHDDTLAA